MNVLVIAAHPDDEIIGLGGTIAKHIKKGDKVYILIISEGVSAQYKDKEKYLKIRRESCLKAARYLGIKKVLFYNLPDGKLDVVPSIEISNIIKKEIEKIKPRRVYTHYWGDLHNDHKKVFECTMVAARNKVKEILCYEIISSTNWYKGMQNKTFAPNFYIDISKELNKKVKALEFYETEIKDFPYPLSSESIKTLARYRGIEAGVNAAEAFICVKNVEI